MPRILTLAIALTTFVPLLGAPRAVRAQFDSLLPLRDWTSSDGKKIKAELLGFQENQAQLRMENGQRVLVPEERFALPDQAELVRARLLNHYRVNLAEGINTQFISSMEIPESRANEGVVSHISMGPNRFTMGIMVFGLDFDMGDYNQVDFADGTGGTFSFPYKDNEVTRVGNPPNVKTRVVVSVLKVHNMELVPLLDTGLENGKLKISVSRSGKNTIDLKLSEEERAGLRDVLHGFKKAQKLVKAGVLAEARLDTQTFGAAGQSPEASMATAPNALLLEEEEAALERFRSNQGQGRFGDMTWTPQDAGGKPELVRGLGWIGSGAVIRTASGEVKKVPFEELDSGGQRALFDERLKELAGKEPTKKAKWSYYYPEGWDDRRVDYSNCLFFATTSDNKKPWLFLHAYSGGLRGEPLTHATITGGVLEKAYKIEVSPAASRIVNSPNAIFTITNQLLSQSDAQQVVEQMKGSPSLQLGIGAKATGFGVPLKEEEQHASREAVDLYHWASVMSGK